MQFTEMEFWLLVIESGAIRADWALIVFSWSELLEYKWRSDLQ